MDDDHVGEPDGPGYTFEPVTQRVIGAAIEVLRQLGPGFDEEIYEKSLYIEFEKQGIAFERQVVITVCYDGRPVGVHRLDLVVEKTVVVELKAVRAIADIHLAQLTAYLRAANLRVGLVLNFGEVPLGIRRSVNRY